MSRAVIVATGDLDHLPQEIQTVSNVLNAAGWKVQLCLGPDASRAGLLVAAVFLLSIGPRLGTKPA